MAVEEEQTTWVAYSDDRGNPYWWNSVSGQSRWTDPVLYEGSGDGDGAYYDTAGEDEYEYEGEEYEGEEYEGEEEEGGRGGGGGDEDDDSEEEEEEEGEEEGEEGEGGEEEVGEEEEGEEENEEDREENDEEENEVEDEEGEQQQPPEAPVGITDIMAKLKAKLAEKSAKLSELRLLAQAGRIAKARRFKDGVSSSGRKPPVPTTRRRRRGRRTGARS